MLKNLSLEKSGIWSIDLITNQIPLFILTKIIMIYLFTLMKSSTLFITTGSGRDMDGLQTKQDVWMLWQIHLDHGAENKFLFWSFCNWMGWPYHNSTKTSAHSKLFLDRMHFSDPIQLSRPLTKINLSSHTHTWFR